MNTFPTEVDKEGSAIEESLLGGPLQDSADLGTTQGLASMELTESA